MVVKDKLVQFLYFRIKKKKNFPIAVEKIENTEEKIKSEWIWYDKQDFTDEPYPVISLE